MPIQRKTIYFNYASFYENGFERSAVLIDERERMKNAHVVKDTSALIEDEDHVGFLAGLMADWLQQYDVTNDAMWLHRANQLFEEVISPFIDTFSTELAHRSSHESYSTVAKLLAGFTAIERLWLELPTPPQKEYPRYVNPLQGVYKKKKKRELYAEEEATLSQSKKNTNQ